MDIAWHDIVGGIGASIVLTTYFLLQIDRISAQSLKYSVLNGIGAAGILVSLSQAFNMSAFVIEAAWLVISIIGAGVTLRRWHRKRTGK